MPDNSVFSVTKHPDLPIVQYTMNTSYRIREHQAALIEDITQQGRMESSPFFLLLDVRELKVEWNDLIFALVESRDANRALQNPLARETLIVTNNSLFKMAMKALNQQQYGEIKVFVFETIEDAVRYVQTYEAQAA